MKRLVLGIVTLMIALAVGMPAGAEPEIHLWFSAEWKKEPESAQKIATELSKASGMHIVPQMAANYPELMDALADNTPELAYVGSMVSAVICSRHLAQPIFQAVDGKHLYAGVMIYPKGKEAGAILKESPEQIAYAVGASAGEVSAKAATAGKATLAVESHKEAVASVLGGKAKAAFVKDYWWEDHKAEYPGLEMTRVPGISENRNPDHVMLASTSVSPEIKALFYAAAFHAPELFKAQYIAPFDSSSLDFTLGLMAKAKLDPLTYSWTNASAGVAKVAKTEVAAATGKGSEILDGAKLVEQYCINCHLLKTLSFFVRDEEQWGRTVADMAKNHGVKMSEAETRVLNGYMAKNFGGARKP